MLSLLRANWKRVLTLMIWTAVVLNVAYFIQRAMLSDNCDAEAIMRQQRSAAAATSVGESCTFARNDSTASSRDPPETNWCMYDDEVDLRIIIMTFERTASLLRLLRQVTRFTKIKLN